MKFGMRDMPLVHSLSRILFWLPCKLAITLMSFIVKPVKYGSRQTVWRTRNFYPVNFARRTTNAHAQIQVPTATGKKKWRLSRKLVATDTERTLHYLLTYQYTERAVSWHIDLVKYFCLTNDRNFLHEIYVRKCYKWAYSLCIINNDIFIQILNIKYIHLCFSLLGWSNIL